MGRLFSNLGLWLAYLGLATVLSELILVGLLVGRGQLDGSRLAQITAVLQGVPLVAVDQAATLAEGEAEMSQVSLEDVAAARAAKMRDLELREQALRKGLDSLDAKTLALLQEKQDFDAARIDFDKRLAAMREGAIAEGEENVRSIISNVKPRQAKELLLIMLEKGELNHVVTILATMTATKRTKIIGEFKSPEEATKLDEILRLMRQGEPLVDEIDRTRGELSAPSATPSEEAP